MNTKSNMTLKNDTKLNAKRWAAYSAAGVAALVSGADTAEADITHVVVGATFTSGDDLYFDLDGNAKLNFSNNGSSALVAVFNGAPYGNVVANGNYVSNLASGVNVASQPTDYFIGLLAYGYGSYGSQFANADGFIGFYFDGGAGTQFGWARVTATGDAPTNSYTIVDYAWADVGESITTGQTVTAVPEPSSLGLLALGAFGVLANRRKKQALAS